MVDCEDRKLYCSISGACVVRSHPCSCQVTLQNDILCQYLDGSSVDAGRE